MFRPHGQDCSWWHEPAEFLPRMDDLPLKWQRLLQQFSEHESCCDRLYDQKRTKGKGAVGGKPSGRHLRREEGGKTCSSFSHLSFPRSAFTLRWVEFIGLEHICPQLTHPELSWMFPHGKSWGFAPLFGGLLWPKSDAVFIKSQLYGPRASAHNYFASISFPAPDMKCCSDQLSTSFQEASLHFLLPLQPS
jgi:hypothetical protein